MENSSEEKNNLNCPSDFIQDQNNTVEISENTHLTMNDKVDDESESSYITPTYDSLGTSDEVCNTMYDDYDIFVEKVEEAIIFNIGGFSLKNLNGTKNNYKVDMYNEIEDIPDLKNETIIFEITDSENEYLNNEPNITNRSDINKITNHPIEKLEFLSQNGRIKLKQLAYFKVCAQKEHMKSRKQFDRSNKSKPEKINKESKQLYEEVPEKEIVHSTNDEISTLENPSVAEMEHESIAIENAHHKPKANESSILKSQEYLDSDNSNLIKNNEDDNLQHAKIDVRFIETGIENEFSLGDLIKLSRNKSISELREIYENHIKEFSKSASKTILGEKSAEMRKNLDLQKQQNPFDNTKTVSNSNIIDSSHQLNESRIYKNDSNKIAINTVDVKNTEIPKILSQTVSHSTFLNEKPVVDKFKKSLRRNDLLDCENAKTEEVQSEVVENIKDRSSFSILEDKKKISVDKICNSSQSMKSTEVNNIFEIMALDMHNSEASSINSVDLTNRKKDNMEEAIYILNSPLTENSTSSRKVNSSSSIINNNKKEKLNEQPIIECVKGEDNLVIYITIPDRNNFDVKLHKDNDRFIIEKENKAVPEKTVKSIISEINEEPLVDRPKSGTVRSLVEMFERQFRKD